MKITFYKNDGSTVVFEKFNPYHGRDGRFTTPNSATSFTYSPGKSKAHDKAIARAKEKNREQEWMERKKRGMERMEQWRKEREKKKRAQEKRLETRRKNELERRRKLLAESRAKGTGQMTFDDYDNDGEYLPF